MEFPFDTTLTTDLTPVKRGVSGAVKIQGGALHTYPFDPSVSSVQVFITTEGKPLDARIELISGPDDIKQFIEVKSENGLYRPFFCVLPTPGTGNVVRIVNKSPLEFPMTADVAPNTVATKPGRYWPWYRDGNY